MRSRYWFIVAALALPNCSEDAVAPSGPTAAFEVTPALGSIRTDFVVDASDSHDPQDSAAQLEVRWDWEDDAVWDTDWTHDKTATHRYATAGNRTLRLEVRDSSGQTDQTTRDVVVELNLAPESAIGVIRTFLTQYAVSIAWSGSDTDGQVAGFWIGWDDPGALQFVATTDSVFTLSPGFGDHTFYCAAQDDEGRVDATPAMLPLNVPHSFLSSPGAVIEGLERAYRYRDLELFRVLLANDPNRNAAFLFLLSQPSEEGDTEWGHATESRVHQRMFQPESPAPGEPPVPSDLWLESVHLRLVPATHFTERPDLYSADGGTDGKLDPGLWRATSALYAASGFFSMLGDTDYQIHGRADFIVIEARSKSLGDPAKFLLLVWEDILLSGQTRSARESVTWSQVKAFYR